MDLGESYEAFSVWECKEGEEHVPRLLLNEAVKGEAVDLNLATDMRVPGRIKGLSMKKLEPTEDHVGGSVSHSVSY